MKCIYCGASFDPDPPRRKVCPSCVKSRIRRMANAANAKMKPVKVKRVRIDHAAQDRLKRIEEAQREFQEMLDREWRQKNVLPFIRKDNPAIGWQPPRAA